jgi:hypothetical protein
MVLVKIVEFIININRRNHFLLDGNVNLNKGRREGDGKGRKSEEGEKYVQCKAKIA